MKPRKAPKREQTDPSVSEFARTAEIIERRDRPVREHRQKWKLWSRVFLVLTRKFPGAEIRDTVAAMVEVVGLLESLGASKILEDLASAQAILPTTHHAIRTMLAGGSASDVVSYLQDMPNEGVVRDRTCQEIAFNLPELLRSRLNPEKRVSEAAYATTDAQEAEGQPTPRAVVDPTDLVSLDQAAATVKLAKRSLERYKADMPPPSIKGGGGKPALWLWSGLRPWLEKTFERTLPERFPGRIDPQRLA